ncbi:hypothetical protein [Pseudoponticoccus marisrubri]|uniref:hypothetical protein n=1 Tax=Pseudoponticoccus marisrubri TaxID=1685382 RepID=UPI0012FD7A0A|nr:hypothetical protein [Pseudoponticoccus marisrubri]
MCDIDCGGLIEAMAHHPRLDRGTALELFFSYSAAAYQSAFREGRGHSYGADDQTLFRAFDRLAERANAGDFASDRFDNRLHDELAHARDWAADPVRDPSHPSNWVRWTLGHGALAPTRGQTPRSELECAQGPVRLRFEVWQRKCA